ncbi:hypothetical protein SprV_0200739300 [Sparganum proliferum]
MLGSRFLRAGRGSQTQNTRSRQLNQKQHFLPPSPPRGPTRQTGRASLPILPAYNVCSRFDNLRSNRPGRRTALVARELARYKVGIAALGVSRFSEQGQLEEVGAGHPFWSGHSKAERRDATLISPKARQHSSRRRRRCGRRRERLRGEPMVSTKGHSPVDALAVLGRAQRQHQNWFDDSDVSISKLLAGKKRLHKGYINRSIVDDKAAFYRSRRLV